MGHKPLWKTIFTLSSSLSFIVDWRKKKSDKPLCARPMNQFCKRSNFSSTAARFNGPFFIRIFGYSTEGVNVNQKKNHLQTHVSSHINYTRWKKKNQIFESNAPLYRINRMMPFISSTLTKKTTTTPQQHAAMNKKWIWKKKLSLKLMREYFLLLKKEKKNCVKRAWFFKRWSFVDDFKSLNKIWKLFN